MSESVTKALSAMRIWISEDAHLGESEISRELEKAEGLRRLEAVEQAIAATLGSDASAVRLSERLRSIADEMRNVGASSMTPHELLACYASDVDKVADSLTFAATLGNKREKQLELLVSQLWYLVNHRSGYGYAAALEAIEELGIEVDE